MKLPYFKEYSQRIETQKIKKKDCQKWSFTSWSFNLLIIALEEICFNYFVLLVHILPQLIFLILWFTFVLKSTHFNLLRLRAGDL